MKVVATPNGEEKKKKRVVLTVSTRIKPERST